ncbi:MAG: hypothetical protein RBS35_05670 [Azonexus sp.]|nr:hypothetical protein [Azonexus sp.]
MTTTVELQCDSSSLLAAMAELSQFAKRFPECVQAFLGAVDCSSELAGLDFGFLVAVSTSNNRVSLEPSDSFLEFLAAMRTRDADHFAVE